MAWLGAVVIIIGAAIYFRCAWEFAVRGLGTPAPIAPTKYLVTTALHRYVRKPMYIGLCLVLAGEAILCRSLHLVSSVPSGFLPKIFTGRDGRAAR